MSIITTRRGGDVVLFYRVDTPKIHCRLRKPGTSGWVQKSTKVTDLSIAIDRAEEWHDDLRFKEKYGLSLTPKTFGGVCDLYIRHLKEDVATGIRKSQHLQDYVPVVTRYLKPYLGDKPIDEIKSRDIADYKRWRASYWITGPGKRQAYVEYVRNGKTIRRPARKPQPPSRSKLNREDVVLRGIFAIAVKYDFLKPFQVPEIPSNGKKARPSERRPCFTVEEYRKLMTFMEGWRQAGPNQERRALLKDCVRFLVHTGVRPGTETDNLLWKHVRNVRTPEGRFGSLITVTGKTGSREVVVVPEATKTLGAIRGRYQRRIGKKGWPQPDVPADAHVFMLPDCTFVPQDYMRGLFEQALKESGLLLDDTGQKRTLYSCRHTFATWQLLYGDIKVYTLAVMMGTSVSMIERHYGHLTPSLAADQLARMVAAEKAVESNLPFPPPPDLIGRY